MNARGERIIVFGDSLTHHGSDNAAEIWDVDAGSNRSSSTPGDLVASLLAEQGAQAVRVNARVSRSAWNFWNREPTATLLASDRAFAPTKVIFILGTNDVGLNPTLDREAFIKLRDTYKAMGAEVWAVGPFSNTIKPDAGVAQVAATMKDVFGMRFIDGRPLSALIHPGGDGLHYSTASARPLALSITDALLTKFSPATMWKTIGLGAAGILGAVAVAFAWKRHKTRGSLLGDIGATPLEAKQQIFELLKENQEGSRAVARDIAIDHGMIKTATVVRVDKLAGYAGTSRVELDTGERFWTSTDHRIKPGGPIDFVLGRGEEYVKDVNGAKLRHLHPAWAFNTDHVWPESLLKRYVNTWWPEDGSESLKGLGEALGKRVSRDDIDAMIAEGDADDLDVAQDALLERGDKLTQIARTHGKTDAHTIGYFELKLGGDKRLTWNVRQNGHQCTAKFLATSGKNTGNAAVEAHYGGAGEWCERAAASDAWAMAKSIKRVERSGAFTLDKKWPLNMSADLLAAMQAAQNTDNSEPEELFGLDSTINIVDGKRHNGSEAELVRSGARAIACKSGLDRQAKCWTLAGLGDAKQMLSAFETQLVGTPAGKVLMKELTPEQIAHVRKVVTQAARNAEQREALEAEEAAELSGLGAARISKKDPKTLTATQINKELDKLDAESSKVNDALINAGRGSETFNETMKMTDPLAREFQAIAYRQSDLRVEIHGRYGPGAPSRLPTDKRGWYGPRKKAGDLDGLGANIGDTFTRAKSKTRYTVTEIVKPARTVGTLKIGETLRVVAGDEVVDITNAQGAWIDGQGRRWKPAKTAGKLGNPADDMITYIVQETTNRTPPWAPSSHKVFISDVFAQIQADGRDDGMTLDEFKRELIRLHRKGKLRLARADLVAAMPHKKVVDSEADANGATFHFIER